MSAPEPAAEAAIKQAPGSKRKGWLRRWLVRLTVVAVVLRIALALGQERLIEYGLGFAGLDAQCGNSSLSLFDGSVRLQNLALKDPDAAPGTLDITIDEVAADISTWQLLTGQVEISDAVLRGVEIEVTRRADGSFVLPAAWTSTAAPESPTAPETESSGPPSFALPLSIAALRIHDVRARLTDEASDQPPLEVVLDADVDDLGRADRPGRIELRLVSDGVADRVIFTASVETPERGFRCDWTLLAHGVDLAKIIPEAARGATPLNLRLRGGVSLLPAEGDPNSSQLVVEADLADSLESARRLKLGMSGTFHGDGASDFEMSLDAEDLLLRPLRALLQNAGVTIVGDGIDVTASATARFATDGSMALGLSNVRIGRGDDAVTLQKATIEGLSFGDRAVDLGIVQLDGPTAEVIRLPDGSISCAGLRLGSGAASPDLAPSPAPSTAVPRPAITLRQFDWRNAALSYTDLGLVGSPTLAVESLAVQGKDLAFARAGRSGSASLSLRAPGVLETLTTDVRVQPSSDGATVEVDLRGEGITLEALTPWFAPAGITPELESGRLSLELRAELAGQDAAQSLSVRLADLRLTDGDEVLVSLRSAELRDFLPGDARLAFGALQVDEPFVLIDRSATATTIAGLAFATKAGAGAATAPGPAAGPATAGDPLEVETGPVNVSAATVRLRDRGPNGSDVAVGIDLELGAMAGSGRAAWAKPVAFAVTVHLQQQLERLSLRGEGARRGDRITVSGRLDGAGIRGAALDPFLPPDVRSSLVDGAIAATLSATLVSGPNATALDCVIRDLQLKDSGVELAAVDLLQFEAPTLSGEEVHISKARVEGVRGLVTTTPDGLQVPGFLLSEPPVAEASAVAKEEAEASTLPPPKGRGSMPKLRLDEVVVASNGLTWRDRRGAEVEPLLTTFRLELAEPWATAEELDASAPLRWRLEAGAAPLIGRLAVTADLQPFALAPELVMHFEATEVSTAAIARVSPKLGESMIGTEQAAQLRFDLNATLELRRSDPTRFDFSRPFGAVVMLENLELLADGGEPLVRLPLVDVDLRAFDPRSGDVLLRSVELESPQILIARTAEGLEVGGVVLRNPSTPAPGTSGESEPGPNPAPVAPAGPEIAIDDLLVYGLDVRFRDTTTEPPTLIPIEELDLSVQRWSSRSLTTPRPFAFRATVRGGTVELPKRRASSSVLAGIAGAATDLVTFQGDKQELEKRPLVEEIGVTGHLQLFPRPKGRIETSIRAFELAALRGLAKGGGVDIGDGVFDTDITVELTAQGGSVRALNTFNWLQISEPPGGPISTYLKLPAPLDLVLFVLRNDNGEQVIPLQIEVPPEGLGGGAIKVAAIEALTLLIGDAIASSPFRAVRTLTDAIGLSGGPKLVTEPVVVEFETGSTEPKTGAIPALIEKVGDDETVALVLTHELSSSDFEHAGELTNPDLDFARSGIARLQAEQSKLEIRRNRLAGEVTARLLAGQVHEVLPLFARLHQADKGLGEIQTSLDGALALFDDDVARHRRRRMRAAGLELADLRLRAVRQELVDRLETDVKGRVVVRDARAVITEDLSAGGRVVITTRVRIDEPPVVDKGPRPDAEARRQSMSDFLTKPPPQALPRTKTP